MKAVRFWALVLILFAAVSVSVTLASAQATESSDLNTALMESTFEIEDLSAQGQILSSGTAFVLGRPYPDAKKERYVLITAAHVLSEMHGDFAVLQLRRKADADTWVTLPFPIRIRSNGRQLWTGHANADVAVMYIEIPNSVSIPLVSTNLLADDAELAKYEIHPGDELECLGYPLGLTSNAAGFPILRSGKIASFPLLPTRATKTFLFDFRVFKGNSGGPVYFVESNRFHQGSVNLGESIHFIIGLVSQESLFNELSAGPYSTEVRQLQLGLAVVVHASLIKETIDMLPPPETAPEY